jgi:hypothetical protein
LRFLAALEMTIQFTRSLARPARVISTEGRDLLRFISNRIVAVLSAQTWLMPIGTETLLCPCASLRFGHHFNHLQSALTLWADGHVGFKNPFEQPRPRVPSAKKLREVHKTWLPAESSGELSAASERIVGIVETYLKSCKMQTPLMSDLRGLASREGFKDSELKQVLHYLTVSGKIYRIEENYLHQTVVDSCRDKLV